MGFDPDLATGQPGSFGLRGLRERAAHLGGELEVRSAPGKGTTVILDMAGVKMIMERQHDPRADR